MSSSTEESTSEVSALELGEVFADAVTAFQRHRYARFGQRGLSPSKVRLILTVSESGGARMGTLATRLGVTGRAVTALVDSLESEGILTRTTDPYDRRAFLIVLTPVGSALVDTIRQLHQEVNEQLFHSLTPDDRRALAELLGKLTTSLGQPDGAEFAPLE